MKRIFVFFFLSIVATAAYAQTKTVVYFNTGQSVLLPRAQRTLDSLAAALQKKGSYRLTING
jgi:outer membrane protein OmpA-like peptidoglycan-associated protein